MSDENKVKVRLLFFAAARELSGTNDTELMLKSATNFSNILEEITQVYPKISQLNEGIIISVNQQYCVPGEILTLQSGDEVAVIPPISGGILYFLGF